MHEEPGEMRGSGRLGVIRLAVIIGVAVAGIAATSTTGYASITLWTLTAILVILQALLLFISVRSRRRNARGNEPGQDESNLQAAATDKDQPAALGERPPYLPQVFVTLEEA